MSIYNIGWLKKVNELAADARQKAAGGVPMLVKEAVEWAKIKFAQKDVFHDQSSRNTPERPDESARHNVTPSFAVPVSIRIKNISK